ncbi:MAG: LPS assembly lipoprotein LptE [Pseudomonadota bacterium]
MGLIAVLTACPILAGCGFTLQGAGELPDEMRATYLETADPRSEFAEALRRTLDSRGQPLVANRAQASAVLRLLQDEAGERILSVSATGVPEELELYHTVRFQLRAGNRVLIREEQITVTRDYRFDPNDILGKRREAQLLKDALVADLVNRFFRRLDLLARENG